MFDLATPRLGIIGLGSVGLPLAMEFGKQFPTVGFEVTYLLPAAAVDGRL